MTRLICSLTASSAQTMRADLLQAFARGADMVECRLDFLSTEPTADDLRLMLAGYADRAIVTCRPTREGGRFAGSETRRLEILSQAAQAGCFAVDVEADVPPANWPRGQVILSHHDFTGNMPDIDDWLRRMDASPAAIDKVAFKSAGPEDCFRAFDAIRSARKPALALAMGAPGLASRILAKKFNAFGTFAALSAGAESAPGQPTLEEFKKLYCWDGIGPRTTLFGVVGHPVAHSMSPAIHNSAFGEIGLDTCYVPLLVEPGWDHFRRFMDELRARPWLDWRGLSVTIPHKENALRYLGPDNCDKLACRIGAVNTITIEPDGSLRGDNTDYSAAVDALRIGMGISREALSGRDVAVLGAGGAARSIVAALTYYGANVTIYNRTLDRAASLAKEFRCKSMPLGSSVDAEIVINCTPLGMHPKVDASPVETLGPAVRVVFDTIYNPLQTRLLRLAAENGCICVSGLDMFVLQAAAQFEIWTSHEPPLAAMRQVVISRLTSGSSGNAGTTTYHQGHKENTK